MAQHVDLIIDKLNCFINTQLTEASKSNALIAFTKPIISRVIDNNIYKAESFLKAIADKDGIIDAESILTDMIGNLVNTRTFKINVNMLGDIEVGDGKVVINMPYINNSIVLDREDLIRFRDSLIE
jgi:hypothetical protein